jgi:hypothetical protein
MSQQNNDPQSFEENWAFQSKWIEGQCATKNQTFGSLILLQITIVDVRDNDEIRTD